MWISGVSGSGKSTLIMEELVPAVEREFHGCKVHSSANDADPDLTGAEIIRKFGSY